MIQRIVLGHIAFRVKLARPLNPESPQARRIAASLALSLNRRLQEASRTGKLPRYPIAAEVLYLHSGSSIAHLQLHADIPCEGGMDAALATFAKTYPDIRKAVQELAADIRIVAANAFGATAGMVEVQVEEEGLRGPAQIEASLCLAKEDKAGRADVLQTVP